MNKNWKTTSIIALLIALVIHVMAFLYFNISTLEQGSIIIEKDLLLELDFTELDEDPLEEEIVEEEEVKKEFDAEELLEGVANLLQPYTEEIKELKEELSVLTSRFNDVADEPAAKKVRNTFSQDAETQKSLTERRLENLISIRKGK